MYQLFKTSPAYYGIRSLKPVSEKPATVTHAHSGVPSGGGWGVKPPTPHPKFRSFDTAAFDCKLSGKCLVFLFQHPN